MKKKNGLSPFIFSNSKKKHRLTFTFSKKWLKLLFKTVKNFSLIDKKISENQAYRKHTQRVYGPMGISKDDQ